MERDDGLVSLLFTPCFAFSLLSDRLLLPVFPAITPAAVSSQDLLALSKHLENCHVVDPCSQLVPQAGQPYCHDYSAPSANPKLDLYISHSAEVPRPHQQPQFQPYHQHPDDMELDIDSSSAFSTASSPPVTPVTTHFVPYAPSFTPSSMSQPLSGCPFPVSAFDTTTAPPLRASTFTMSDISQTRHDTFGTFSVSSPLQASQKTTSASRSRPGTPCNFVPKNGVVVNENVTSGAQATKGELDTMEREIERRLRLFACGIDDCLRRYKDMDGLRMSV